MISIVSAFAAMVLYWLTDDWGTAQPDLRNGLVHYYLHSGYRHLHHVWQ